jgi:hypothetical protein
MGNIMQYKCIRGVVTSQGPLQAGDLVSLPANEAVALVAAGKLAIVTEEAVRVAEAPVVEHRDPVMPKRGRPPRAG